MAKARKRTAKTAAAEAVDKDAVVYLAKKDLFRIDEAAEYFGVTPRTIRLWIDHGKLEFERIGGVIRIPREAILEIRFFPK